MNKNKKRADGYYCVSVYMGTENGKRRYKFFYGKTMTEAQTAADAFKRKINSVTAPQDALFRDLAAAWLDKKSKTVGAAQTKTLQGFVNVLNAEIGDIPILDVTETALASFLSDLADENPRTGKPSSQSTVNKYFQVIQGIFRFSRLQPNPAEYLEMPKGTKQHDRRALTAEEQRRVCDLEHRAQLPAMLAMYAGLRRGELSALRWEDIDLSARLISVNKSLDFVSGAVKTPKTAAGVRTVYILPPLYDFLKKQKRRSGLIIAEKNGKPMTVTAWRSLWASYLCDMDVKYGGRKKQAPGNTPRVYSITPFTLHELRHTYATILHDAGVDVKAAQKWLGHADASTTMNVYTHISEQQQTAAVNALDAYFSRPCK